MISTTSETHQHKSKDLNVEKVITKSTFTIYLAQSKVTKQKFAMKFFPLHNGKSHPSYQRESRMVRLSHPNIIKFNEAHDNVSTSSGKASYILMDYAKHGDLAELISNGNYPTDEKLARTYFHQLVSAIEYLHKNNIAHLDLKPDNFLLADDFSLKLTDFDSAVQTDSDEKIVRPGTVGYRAPEVKSDSVDDPKAADIYSMGIILFVLALRSFPYLEDDSQYSFQDLLIKGSNDFWKNHPCSADWKKTEKSEFKKLVMGMVRESPSRRMTISEIKKNEWYKGPVYTQRELQLVMSTVVDL